MPPMYGRDEKGRGFAGHAIIGRIAAASLGKSMKRWVRYLLAVLGILPIVVGVRVARADIPQPDTAPTVTSIAIYRNLRQPGDTLFRIYANIPYASMPTSGNVTVPVQQAYLWRLLDGSSNLVGANSEFPYHTYGYGYNVASLYFDNVTAITWSGTYTIQLVGIPPGFTGTAPTWSFNIPGTSWSTSSTQADEQDALTADVINLSGKLDGLWGNTSATSLLFQSEVGAVLSLQGEYFWNGAIPGLQGLAPKAFQIVVGNINTTPPTWSDNYSQDLASQWTGVEPWLATAQQGGADFFNLGWDLLSVILVFGVGLALVIGNVALTGDAWNGLIDVSFWMIMAGRMGLYGLAFLGLIVAICLIYIALKIWGLR